MQDRERLFHDGSLELTLKDSPDLRTQSVAGEAGVQCPSSSGAAFSGSRTVGVHSACRELLLLHYCSAGDSPPLRCCWSVIFLPHRQAGGRRPLTSGRTQSGLRQRRHVPSGCHDFHPGLHYVSSSCSFCGLVVFFF